MKLQSRKMILSIIAVGVVIVVILLIKANKDVARLSQGNSSSQPQTQQQLYPEQKITHGHGVAVDVGDSNKLYIATHHGLLVLINEKDLYRVGKSKDDYMGFSVHPASPNIFFSSGHPSFGGNIGFQKSEDGGEQWKKVSNGVGGPVDFHSMAVSPVNPDLIYGWYRGNLQRSLDGGKNWEIVNRTITAVYLVADPQDEQVLYAAAPTGEGVLVSRDTGITWSPLSQDVQGGQVSVIAVNPNTPNEMLAFSEKMGGLVKSVNKGLNWQKVNESFGGETILHIAFDKNTPQKVYALTHENALYKSMDSGDSWVKVR